MRETRSPTAAPNRGVVGEPVAETQSPCRDRAAARRSVFIVQSGVERGRRAAPGWCCCPGSGRRRTLSSGRLGCGALGYETRTVGSSQTSMI